MVGLGAEYTGTTGHYADANARRFPRDRVERGRMSVTVSLLVIILLLLMIVFLSLDSTSDYW